MSLVLPIGKNSDGTDFAVPVSTHFFISHACNSQLYQVFDSVLQTVALQVSKIKTYVFCHSDYRKENDDLRSLVINYFYKNEPEGCFVNNPGQFVNFILQEVKKRQRLCAKARVANVSKLPVRKRPQRIIVLVDNIWDWIVLGNKRNSTAIKILEILSIASAMRVYCFFGSALPYKNLLPQLIETNSKFKEKLGDKAKSLPGYPQVTYLGNQIIFTTDGLTYFKEKGSVVFQGLY